MKRVTTLLGTAVVILATAGLFAQAKTSFAGKWTLVPDPNAAAAGGGGGRGGRGGGMGMEFTVAQDDKTMTVTRTTQAGEVKSVYNLDGSDSKNTMNFGGNPMEQVSKAKWDGAKLVITTSFNMNGNAVETSQTWSLEGGNLVIEQAGRQGGPPTKTTYKKS
jgi:hypothetical protein